MKENIRFESLPTPVAIGFFREDLDIVIERLREGVGEMMSEVRRKARCIGFHLYLEPTAIQMPPLPPLGPMNVGTLAAHRTVLHIGAAVHGHRDRQRRRVHVRLLHKPRLFQPQQSLIQRGVVHSQSLRGQAKFPRDFSKSRLSKGVLGGENT